MDDNTSSKKDSVSPKSPEYSVDSRVMGSISSTSSDANSVVRESEVKTLDSDDLLVVVDNESNDGKE